MVMALALGLSVLTATVLGVGRSKAAMHQANIFSNENIKMLGPAALAHMAPNAYFGRGHFANPKARLAFIMALILYPFHPGTTTLIAIWLGVHRLAYPSTFKLLLAALLIIPVLIGVVAMSGSGTYKPPKDIWRLLDLMQEVYWVSDRGTLIEHRETGTRAWVVGSNVVFRGTVSGENLAVSAQGHVREGFHAGYLNAVESLIDSGLPTEFDEPVTILGHSMGGGLALIYATLVKAPEVRVVTTSMPGVCTRDRARELSARLNHYRIYNPCDLVSAWTGHLYQSGKPCALIPPGMYFMGHYPDHYRMAMDATLRDHLIGSVHVSLTFLAAGLVFFS